MNRSILRGIYLIGFVFLALTIKSWSDYKNSPKTYLDVEDYFDLNIFLISHSYYKLGENFTFEKDHITALYLINSADCSPCLNEVKSYNIFLEDKYFHSLPIKQLVVVLDPDRKRAKRFSKVANFRSPVVYGFEKTFANNLCSFGKHEVKRQLIFINNNSNTIFFRAYLKKGKMTSINEKEKIFAKAQKAFLKLKTTN